MARTMKEKALYIEEQKKRMYEQFILKGYTPTQITELLANYPKLIAGLNCQPLPQWFLDALVCHYNPSKQGLTNDQIKVGKPFLLKDLSGNNLDMTIYNMAGSGMSGMDGYVTDFATYKPQFTDTLRITEATYNKVVVDVFSVADTRSIISDDKKTDSFKIRVEFPEGDSLTYAVYYQDTGFTTILEIPKSGVYTIPKIEKEIDFAYFRMYGNLTGEYVIEQLPLYEGGLVFDGTDDYGEALNVPKLTDFTIMAKRKFLEYVEGSTRALLSKGNADETIEFERRFTSNRLSVTSFGVGTNLNTPEGDISVFTKNTYNGIDINSGAKEDGTTLLIGKGFRTQCLNFVLYDILLFNRTLTPDEIDWVKYNIMGEELPKPIAKWDAEGRRNDEPSAIRNILLDKTGNGHHITLNNMAWAGGSGYGGFLVSTFEKWTNNPDIKQNVTITPYKMTITSQKVANASQYTTLIKPNEKFICNVDVKGIPSGAKLTFANNVELKEGRNRIEYTNTAPIAVGYGFALQSNVPSCNLEISLVGEYENAIVFDGVDDYGICENMPIFTKEKGYCVIAERVVFSRANSASCVITKRTGAFDGAFWFEREGETASFGNPSSVTSPSRISYQTSKSYNGNSISTASAPDTNTLSIATATLGLPGKTKMALYQLHIFDHDLTPSAIEAYIRRNINKNYVLPTK